VQVIRVSSTTKTVTMIPNAGRQAKRRHARDHVVRLEPQTKWDCGSWWRALCTCGYRSRLMGYRGAAYSAGEAHAKAFGGQVITSA
jgi:hypothetical protein